MADVKPPPFQPEPARLNMTIGEYVLKYMGERRARSIYGDEWVAAAKAKVVGTA